MNVESFNLDHRVVSAPYVRLADRKQLPAGDVIVKYDVRFTQPNVAHLEMPTVHSLEHLFAEHSRNHSDAVLDFSPMGCQTGFYLMLQGDPAYEDVLSLIEATLRDILRATEVPAANEVQCGWGANHTLTGAQEAASVFLSARGVWAQVFDEGAPGEASAADMAARDAAARAAAVRDATEKGIPLRGAVPNDLPADGRTTEQ
ncbi:S-ribosylhomocysteine lyase /quorum-sensing autoinducer 2 (AI-2) synthesis protein LuxS [Promicromonospora thailandica]|uniref:S-ribosylhomocysteine lyase n=1 Tax=Promicromonospora thailandica TaxID=765201 RepID=A0A9X2JWX0_9MICO|nr:S-ribosylhomocysteine lyase /quorum-sensing autoinducer 2 (AI-2) synthesis protein LuxS [Promicromonospora thailandica]